MKHLFVAVDGSERKDGVLAAAVALASQLGGQLTLFRAVTIPLDVPPALYAIAPNDVGDVLSAEAKKDLAALAAKVPPALLREVKVAVGVPWQAVTEGAKAAGADLIVVGSHGFRGIDRLLGTTADKVVHHADRPVLVIR